MNQKLLKRLIPVLLACALAAGAAGYFFNKPAPPQENPVLEEYVDPALTEGVFNTNLTGITFAGGKWEGTDEGLHSTALGAGDCFLYSDTSAKNFIYSVDVKFLKDEGAASLVFRGDERGSHYNCYAVNLDAGSKLIKFWRWFKGDAGQLSSELKVEERPDKCYNLKVVVIDSWVSYFVNDVLMASSGDYILSGDARGQYTVPEEGYLGLLNWNGDMIFQNAYYTPIEDDAKPYLKSMTVRASGGSAEASSQFSFDEPITLQYVDNDTETVDIAAEAFSKDAVITVAGPDGREMKAEKAFP
jgi:fructan beta-fructosidase